MIQCEGFRVKGFFYSVQGFVCSVNVPLGTVLYAVYRVKCAGFCMQCGCIIGHGPRCSVYCSVCRVLYAVCKLKGV